MIRSRARTCSALASSIICCSATLRSHPGVSGAMSPVSRSSRSVAPRRISRQIDERQPLENARFITQVDVFRNGKLGKKIQFLVQRTIPARCNSWGAENAPLWP